MDIWIEFWIEMLKPMVPVIQPILSIPLVDKLISDWFDLNGDWLLQLYIIQQSMVAKDQ
jgi:hypothetical protein